MKSRSIVSLRDRDLRKEGIVVGEGRLVAERVASRCRLIAIVAEKSAAAEAEALSAGRCPVEILSSDEIAAVAGYAFHRGILVIAERPRTRSLRDIVAKESTARGRLVALPNPTDPENLGAIIRSAAALGWDGAILGPTACDPYGRRALRCSMGATLSLPLYEASGADALSELERNEWISIAAAMEPDAREPGTLGEVHKIILVLGNERNGIPSDWRSRCDYAVAIPQGRGGEDGVDSLNVAAAAAILLWEGSRLVGKTNGQ